MTEVKKNLQEIVNLIVALNGCENCYDEDTAAFKPWEVVDLLTPFADANKVQEIRDRHFQIKVLAPKWSVPGQYSLQRRWHLRTYPGDQEIETTYEYRRNIHTVETVETFWVNLLDDPWTEDKYVGWKYVIRFVDNALPGTYLVSEDSLFIMEKKDVETNYD